MKTNKSKYPKNSGFKAPEDYFRNFEDRFMQKLEGDDLTELPVSASGFHTPQGYFDTLEDRLIAQTKDETKVVKLFRKEYLLYAAAVAAIFILMLGNFFKTETAQPIGWDDIEVSAMESYIDEGYDMGYIELNSAEISDFVFEDGKLIDDSDFNSVNSDAVFDYIDENIEDPAFILE
ncbi:hypothetical protein [Christiangramia sp. SM2212]|uniref:Uncharacterized protein n=1 Tax=Christiangramia sediminicola TaxID=3073267 RepID=A0ABU1ENS5_9FLAO|nr:hypothetical protein [Christiangramia sp. SM2212]MDR5590040.1 hypothetical protein [Christiangramia sp. SM2212]